MKLTTREKRLMTDILRHEAAGIIAEWDRLMSFVKKNNLPEPLLDTALDNRLRLMKIRDGDIDVEIEE